MFTAKLNTAQLLWSGKMDFSDYSTIEKRFTDHGEAVTLTLFAPNGKQRSHKRTLWIRLLRKRS